MQQRKTDSSNYYMLTEWLSVSFATAVAAVCGANNSNNRKR